MMAGKNPYSLRALFELMALDLINSLKRNMRRHQLEEGKEGFRWEQWQLAKLRALEQFRRANREIIGRYRPEVEELLADVLQQSFLVGGQRVDAAVRASIRLPASPPAAGFFGMNEKKLQALQESVAEDLAKAQHAVLRHMDDVYRQTIFRAQLHMTAGAKTLDQAVDMATKEFLDAGIQCVEYRDGRRANIASYAEMALRTASQRATFLGEGQKRNEWGVYTIFVSAHATACDLCIPYQGKVLIDDVYSGGLDTGEYPLLSEAIKAGLLHVNCRHTLSIYFPGITKLPTVPDEATMRKNYIAEQKQRHIERQIRRWKRHEAGSLDAENVNKASHKVKEWQGKLREHLQEHPQLRRDYGRERLLGNIDTAGSGDIISSREWLKASFSTEKRFERHIKDHLKEYGDITSEKYLNTARDLLAAPLGEDVEGFLDKAGYVYKYRISTNDFAIGRPDGRISTLFKPADVYQYWLREIEKRKGK